MKLQYLQMFDLNSAFSLNNILFEFKNMSSTYIHTGYMRI